MRQHQHQRRASFPSTHLATLQFHHQLSVPTPQRTPRLQITTLRSHREERQRSGLRFQRTQQAARAPILHHQLRGARPLNLQPRAHMLHLQPRARTLHMRIKALLGPQLSRARARMFHLHLPGALRLHLQVGALPGPQLSRARNPIPHLRLPGAPKLHLQARALMLRLHLRGALKLHPRARPRMLGLQLSRARAPTLHPHPASPLMPGPQRSRARPPTLHTQARPSTLHLARFTTLHPRPPLRISTTHLLQALLRMWSRHTAQPLERRRLSLARFSRFWQPLGR